MKKILLITLLLVPFLGFTQTTKPIEGFLGIKFGSTRAEVIAAIRAKGGVIDKSNTDPTVLMFRNVKLGQRLSKDFQVAFVNNQACEALYVFNTDVEAQVPGYYDDLVSDLTDVYGQGKVTKDYTSPYTEGDGDELLGLSVGKITFKTLWVDSINNSLLAYIDTDMTIVLTYQSDKLMTEYIAKLKAKEKGDY